MRNKATATGPSAWAQAQLGANKLQGQKSMEAANQQAISGLRGAQARLAMRGGMAAGAGERLAAQGNRNVMAAKQNAGFQTALNSQNIMSQDEQMKNQMLGQSANVEQQRADSFTNLQRLQNQDILKLYEQQMQGWAAGQTAGALSRSGGGK